MREWTFIIGGNILAWFGAFMTLEHINIIAATLTSVFGVIVSVVYGIQKILEGKYKRKASAEEYKKKKLENELKRKELGHQKILFCETCISMGGVDKRCHCLPDDRPKRCPKNRNHFHKKKNEQRNK